MIRQELARRQSAERSGFRWRGAEVSRLEQFSDAVFAFALALLVVSIDVPTTTEELFAVLADFPAFGATFAVLVFLWYGHYVYFRRFGLIDPLTIFLNGVLLFLILFYVYPLKFLTGALIDSLVGLDFVFSLSEGRSLLVVYSLGFVSVFGMFALLYLHAFRLREDLGLNPLEVGMTKATMIANILLVALGTAAALLAGIGTEWALALAGSFYAAIGPLMWWHWTRAERALSAQDPTAPGTRNPLSRTALLWSSASRYGGSSYLCADDD